MADAQRCMQAAETEKQKEGCEVKHRGLFVLSQEPLVDSGERQYLTLRDLSSHDQVREEGKVGREEAAVPKGPLPI